MAKKLYACCTKPNCKTHQALVEFLGLWGLPTKAQMDGKRAYYDVTVPPYWMDNRRERFARALKLHSGAQH